MWRYDAICHIVLGMRQWIFVSLTLVSLFGCGRKKASEATYLLPWADIQGRYQLQEVTISTLSSPYDARGAAAEIYFQPMFSPTGFEGQPVQPRLTQSGHVYVPMDAASSLALSVYAQFERLYFFERRLGFAGQLSWPRKVGVELNIDSGGGTEHNNAHYFTEIDVIGILPYALNGVPFAVNQGIVAHEHFHAHFQTQVIHPLQQSAGVTITSAGDPEAGAKFLNDLVMRGWNEGLADFFAAIYTGKPDFFTDSMPQVARTRAVDAALLPLWTGADIAAAAASLHYDRERLVAQAYTQGTALARLMYRLARSGSESPLEFLARVMNRLADVPAAIRDGYAEEVMDSDRIVPVLLRDFPLNDETCDDLKWTMTKPAFQRSFPTCAER
jgi:hypothetical protein